MRTGIIRVAGVLPLLLISCAGAGRASDGLPQVVVTELKRLEETYRVLDFVAEKVWPGWSTYRKVPLLLEYENGLRLLIGHPSPPPQFQAVPGLKLEDKEVFADRSALSPKPLVAPLRAGGGLIPFGAGPDGQRVQVVLLNFRSTSEEPADPEDAEAGTWSTEAQIALYIHELFHCFQRERLTGRVYGNLQYNPDVNYASYSEIEGLALHRAYLEPDAAQARQYLADFLAARKKKRAGSMTPRQQDQESSEEFSEGTARYSELRTLELLRSGGFTPKLTTSEDPYYHGFREADSLLRRYPERLRKAAARTEDPRSKSYEYGCFQAALCERWFPGWQESLTGGTEFLDRELSRRLRVPEEEWPQIERRLQEAYPLAEIQKRHAQFIEARDDAYRRVRTRTGRVYVVDCKRTGQYLPGLVSGARSYELGLITLFPEGIGSLRFDEVELTGLATPVETNQLYYLRAVDTDWLDRQEVYSLQGARQPDGTWKDAVVRTPLFTLKAPRVRIQEAPNLVKIQVLARVKD